MNKILILLSMSFVLSHANDITTSATAPFNDFGITKLEIPEIALKAVELGYSQPANCDLAWFEMKNLEPYTKEEKISTANKVVNSAVEDVMTGWIPFRGVVRKVSGAEKDNKNFNNAMLWSKLRFSYLKGYTNAKCDNKIE